MVPSNKTNLMPTKFPVPAFLLIFIVILFGVIWTEPSTISKLTRTFSIPIFSEEVFTVENEVAVLGMLNGKPCESKRAEIRCMENHTQLGLEDYIKMSSQVGFKELTSLFAVINTRWGVKPKMFLYIGEKIN